MSPIIRIYANLVLNGAKTIDEVPSKYRLAVETYLANLNI